MLISMRVSRPCKSFEMQKHIQFLYFIKELFMFNKLQTPSSKTLLFINQKTHNWDPFKILIPTCRIICFLLIFALTRGSWSSLQGLSVLVMGLDGIQCHWNCCTKRFIKTATRKLTNTAVCLQIIINKGTLCGQKYVDTCTVQLSWLTVCVHSYFSEDAWWM